MKKRICLIGEVLVDLIADSNLNISPSPGGSIFNTANTLSKLGAKTSFYSQIGDDLWGKYLIQKMTEVGIDHNFVKISSDFKTPLAFATLDENNNAHYDFYKSKFNYTIQNNDLYNAGIFHFGSFFSVLSENQKNIQKIFNTSKKEKYLISYDPNYRKNFTKDNMKNLFNNFKNSHIIKLSLDDMQNIFGISDIKIGVDTIKKFNPLLIIITAGKDGSYLSFLDKPIIKVDAENVTVVDTIGAGDSYSSGLLYYLYQKEIFTKEFLLSLKEENLYDMLRFATKISSISLTIKGADIPKDLLSKV